MNKGNISAIQGTGILLSTLLGSGVLVIPALAASESGSYSLLAWVLMALAILPIVFTFSALGKQYPNDGGTAHFVKLAFGDRAAKSIGWLYVSIAPIGPPVVFIAGAAYLAELLSIASDKLLLLELTMLAAIYMLNRAKLETSIRFQTILSFVVTAIIIIVCGLALLKPTAPIPQVAFSAVSLGKSMAIIFWCFVGIEAICHIANDFRDPKKDFPRVVIFGVTLAATIYFVLSIAVLKYQAFGSETDNLLSIANIANIAVGSMGHKLIALVGFIACFCAVNIYVVSFARMLYSMSLEKAVPKALAKKNANGCPLHAINLIVLSIGLVLLVRAYFKLPFEVLLEYANGVFVLIYLAAALAGVKLLRGVNRLCALFSALFCLIIAVFMGANASYGILVLIFSWLIYRRIEGKILTPSP